MMIPARTRVSSVGGGAATVDVTGGLGEIAAGASRCKVPTHAASPR